MLRKTSGVWECLVGSRLLIGAHPRPSGPLSYHHQSIYIRQPVIEENPPTPYPQRTKKSLFFPL